MTAHDPSPEQIAGILRRHMPRGWTHIVWKNHAIYHGLIWRNRKRIYTARVINRNRLFHFLHEVGHLRLGHYDPRDTCPVHVEEYEAEKYAIKAMHNEGVAVPRSELARAKRNVRIRIRDDRRKKLPIDPRAMRWAFS